MKIAHCADVHYCPKHLKWVDRAFSTFVSDAEKYGADVAVIAGDSFDASMGIHEPAVSAYLRSVMMLAAAMPVLVLQGTYSHDRPGCLDILKNIPTAYPIHVADEPRQVALSADRKTWSDEIDGCAVLFSCLPSINKADPAIMAGGARAYVEQLAAEWAPKNRSLAMFGTPTVLVTHGTINGCVTESGYAMISPDWEFDTALLYAFLTDAVMLGHIHKHQSWIDGMQVIAYPGSIARLVHGDHDQKGYLAWDVAPGTVSFDFVEIPGRQLLEIEFDGPPDMAELAEISGRADADTYVRIRWSIDQEHAHRVDKAAICELFAASAECKLEGVVNPVQSVRAAGIGKAMTLREKLGYYAATTGDEDKLPDMEARLEMLQTMDPEQIVRQLTTIEKHEAA